MTLKNNRALLLCYLKLGASFHSHWWIHSGVTVRKYSIWARISKFLLPVTLKFERWPRKTIKRIFYATPSFVHHFIAINEFKLQLESGNAQFGSKLAILAVTKQLNEWFTPSVRLSVSPFCQCSGHRITMKFSDVITIDKSDIYAKGQGQRSKVKVTEVITLLNSFRTVTPCFIHK